MSAIQVQVLSDDPESRKAIISSLAPQTEGSFGHDLINAGADIYAWQLDEPLLVPTGVKMVTGVNLAPLILPRSSLGHKKKIAITNAPGLIDADYRGELFVSVYYFGKDVDPNTVLIQSGERIAQLLFVPVIKPRLVFGPIDDITERGEGAFGSTN